MWVRKGKSRAAGQRGRRRALLERELSGGVPGWKGAQDHRGRAGEQLAGSVPKGDGCP